MKIVSVKKGSQAEKSGLKPGDKVVEINHHPVRDSLDLMYYSTGDDIRLTIHRGTYEFLAAFKGNEDFGIEFEPIKIMTCSNHCIFCFIDQNPPGMRRTIYVKDEDYRLSFLHGAYVTLSNLGIADLERIVAQHLSPLYISVHATDTEVRMKLLGITVNDSLLDTMERLLKAGIQLHCQVVVCPGINDGTVLERTISDLRGMSRNILSVAVVPVGLTRHRRNLVPLKPVDDEDARNIIRLTDSLHKQYREETGEGFVYCADELFIRAGLPVPGAEYYDDFHQVENGVGMVRRFLDAVVTEDVHQEGKMSRTGSFVFVTGVSMGPFIEDFAHRVSLIPGIHARTVAVTNLFYGDTVTVSGLLTGSDILAALGDIRPGDIIVLPPNCLNEDGIFLDDMTPEDMSGKLGEKIIQGGYDPWDVFR